MRYRSIPYTSTLITVLFIYCFPLLEFDLIWNYVDWDTSVSQRSGSSIVEETEKLSFPRVPGIEPTWSMAHRRIQEMLYNVNSSILPEYGFTWYYRDASGVDSVDKSFHINNGVGGYIAILYPRSTNLTSSYRSVCTLSNMDSVYGSSGFSSNALGVTQSILALEELSQTPGLVNPITIVITEVKENGANLLVNMYSLPELQKCAYSIVLDSLGLAQTVPEAIHITDLSGKVLQRLPRVMRYLRVSNYVLDAAISLSLLSSSETKLLYSSSLLPALSKIDYVDNQFRFHSFSDNSNTVSAAAVKARYDRILDMNRILSHTNASQIQRHYLFLDYASYASVGGVTFSVSSLTQFFMILVGMTCSVLFLRYWNMGDKTAVTDGARKALVIMVLQFVIFCAIVCFLFLWFTLDPLVTHKINPYILSVLLTLLTTALIQCTLHINFYTQYFTRDHAGAMMSVISLLYGSFTILSMLLGLHISLNFAFPSLCFGITNIPLFIRRLHWGDRYQWKKLTYAIFVALCGILCFIVNMGSACATLHVAYGMMSNRDLSVNIVITYAFWNAIFPIMFCGSCIHIIYMFDSYPFPLSSVSYSPLLPPEGTQIEQLSMEKIVVRRFFRWLSIFTCFIVLFIVLVSSHLSAWNSENPVAITAGISYSEYHYEGEESDQVTMGSLMMTGKSSSLQHISRLLPMLHLKYGYAVANHTEKPCYLEGNVLTNCIEVKMTRYGKPIEHRWDDTSLNISHIVSIPLLSKGNFSYYWRDYEIVIPPRPNINTFGYPFVHFRVYTTTQRNMDTKLYSNAIEMIVQYQEKESYQKGFVLTGVILTNGTELITIPVKIRSRVGSQVVFRVMDVSHAQSKEIEVLQNAFGYGFILSSNSDYTSYSFANTYFFSY